MGQNYIIKFIKVTISAILLLNMSLITPSLASGSAAHPKQLVWPFTGVFGKFDRQSAQRGAKVYFEVCAACHGMNNLYYRNLTDLGFSKAEVKQIASNYNVTDGPDAVGDMFERPAIPSDKFVSPYPNQEAARASNGGSYPIDLSLIVKARHDGANYIYSLLTGYGGVPSGLKTMPGLNYNKYFEGGQIAMPPPLMDDQVEYMDGTKATVEQMSRDVTIFLQWAAEPEMEHRKSMGLKVIFFLFFFTVFFYISYKKIWKDI
jgi:ubiquinol-cytochrome c reductase cytochrome c1 subunit